MRNKIDLSSEPEVMFLNPWREGGLKLLERPEFIWREHPAAVIEGFDASAHAEINAKIRTVIEATHRQKRFDKAVEMNTVAAVVEHASYRKSHILVGDRLVLSGASATRLINAYRSEHGELGSDTLNTYFQKCRHANAGQQLSVEKTFVESDLDLAIACRNTFNYFHFITESLSQLCVLDDIGFQGNIFFHFPNQADKQGAFAAAFVGALFPEFRGRVFFERAPKDYDLVLTSFEMLGAACQFPQSDLDGLDRLAPRGMAARAKAGSVEFQPILAMNAVPSSLLALRARGLKAIEGRDFSHLPKRFFVGRGENQSRPRPLDGADLLLRHLGPFGFQYVVFENLDPLEQIALMAQAEVMISHHGAGFANMLFAHPDAFVIELGTLQTAQFRWADFWPLANAAQCRYINFFADFSSDNPLLEPQFSVDGIVPTSVSDQAVAQIVSFVVSVLGHAPTMPDTRSLATLTRRVLRAGAAEQAIALLREHQEMVVKSGALCLLVADCHKAMDAPKSELMALEAAHRADPARWQTLVRIIWCANRCERPQVIRWALSRLKDDFPDRHDAFVSNHDWVRFVA